VSIISYVTEGVPISSEIANNLFEIEARMKAADNPNFKEIFFKHGEYF